VMGAGDFKNFRDGSQGILLCHTAG
jgi:hypothetical protein